MSAWDVTGCCLTENGGSGSRGSPLRLGPSSGGRPHRITVTVPPRGDLVAGVALVNPSALPDVSPLWRNPPLGAQLSTPGCLPSQPPPGLALPGTAPATLETGRDVGHASAQ